MDFGKVKDTRNIDFTLPPDDPATAARLVQGRSGGPLRVYVGCPVWQDDAMARKLCAPRTPKAKRLACYGRQFNALEVNSTGYGLVRERAAQWASETPEGFRFCPKVPMDVTHGANLDGVWQLFAAQCEAAQAFGDRLGLFFLQFPEQFGPARFGELERLLATQAGKLPLAVEVRHAGWFQDARWKNRLFDMLEAQGIASILTDTPGRRDALHQRLTTSTAFIRFNGHALGPEDYGRLDAWALRVKAWMALGLRELYLFPHLDPVDRTVELAAHFIASLNRAAGLNLKMPRIQQAEDEEPSLAL
ncbi:MAG TPA: DUF72 domain-containing protein [Fibrobacteria bacterium]|nr:DUF72 domain-containing protein [Fibrobacteria bacterium]